MICESQDLILTGNVKFGDSFLDTSPLTGLFERSRVLPESRILCYTGIIQHFIPKSL